MLQAKRLVLGLVASLVLAIGAAPAASAQPVVTGGLVNITIFDVVDLRNVTIQVPIGVAANVCGVQANVLAKRNEQGPVDCRAETTQDLPVAFRP